MKKATFIILTLFPAFISACALGPVETDPDKAQARYSRMREDCYQRGGTWNDSYHTCVGADPIR